MNTAYQPVARTEKASARIGATEELEFRAGNVQRLRGKECVDEEIRDAVAADEGDGFGEFGSAEVPMPTPVGVIEIFEEGAESLRWMRSR